MGAQVFYVDRDTPRQRIFCRKCQKELDGDTI